MDLLINRVKRSEIKPGDHIYTYRAVLANSHHGIFVGENKVVHFTPSFYKSPLTCSSNPNCGFRQPNNGVVRSCLDCFLENGSLYRFKYEVSLVVFLAHARDGTCSIAKSDPPEEVIHRAVYLLGSGFGKYDVLQNNSVDFALYCKTSLRVVDKENNDIGSINGQYLQWLPPLFLFVTKRPMTSVYMAIFSSILEAGKYCMKRYKTDIGVRADVMRVAVEDLVMTTRPVPMNSESIPILDETNFSDWSEQVQFYLGIRDLDLAFRIEKPPAITDSSNAEEKAIYNSWERSNRLSMMLMKMNIANNIKSTLLECDSAKEFFKIVEERFRSVDKCLMRTLMAELITMKFDDTQGMHEHILGVTNLITKLKALGINLDELFVVQFIFNSLPLQYESFQIHYNTIKDKWNVDELASMLVQEEARLKQQEAKKIELPEVNGPPQVIEVHEKRQNNVIEPLEVNRPLQVTEVHEKRQNNVIQPPEVNGSPQVIGVHEKRQNNVIQPPEVNGPPQVIEIHEKRRNSVQCHFCKKFGHVQKNCYKHSGHLVRQGAKKMEPHKVNGPSQVIEVHDKRQNNVQCYFCKMFGHVQKNCHIRRARFKKKGLPYYPDLKPQ